MSTYTAGFDADRGAPGPPGRATERRRGHRKDGQYVSGLVAARLAGGAVPGQARPGAAGPARPGPRRRALASSAGTSLGEARRAIAAGQAMADQPEVAAAARAGELSAPGRHLVSGAAEANPGATERLLATARKGSLGELAAEAGRARAGART